MEGVITESTEAVQLEKRFEEKEFGLPSVVYELDSKRTDTVEIRIVEQLSAELDADDIGFQRKRTRENWEVTPERLVFEATLGHDGAHTTMYALHPDISADVDELLTRPTEFEVSPVDGDDDTATDGTTGSAERLQHNGESGQSSPDRTVPFEDRGASSEPTDERPDTADEPADQTGDGTCPVLALVCVQ